MNKYVFDHDLAGTRWCAPYHHFPGTNQVQDLTVPALEPPKRFLMEGSSIWVGTSTHYEFMSTGSPTMGHGDHVHLIVDKHHHADPYLRLMNIHYYFMRDKNCMMEKKGAFVSIVYNLKTRLLYTVKREGEFGKKGKKTGHKKVVKRISLNKHGIPTSNLFSKRNRAQFFSTLMRKLEEDVPGILDECRGFAHRLIALNIQHRVGRPIPGLIDEFVDNMTELTKASSTESIVRDQVKSENGNLITEDSVELLRLTRNLQAKTTYRFMPTLIKTHSVKKALKAMLHKVGYIPILPQLLHNINIGILTWNTSRNTSKYLLDFLYNYNDNVPKPMQHHIARLCSEGNYIHVRELFSEIINIIRFKEDQNMVIGYNRRNRAARLGGLPHIIDAWVKTTIRFNKPIRWVLWKDLYVMSQRLNISRIRPSKFNTIEDVVELHDTFSDTLRIRKPSKCVIDESLMTFLEVEYPKGILEDVPGGPWEFIQLLTQDQLQEESDRYGHCVHDYSEPCFDGKSLIFRLELHGTPVYTVEFRGSDMSYSQAEGGKDDMGRRVYATLEIIDQVIMPFQKHLASEERKQPLNYETRAELRADLVKIWHQLPKLENRPEVSESIDKCMELVNEQLEQRMEIDRMIRIGAKESDIIEKFKKIEYDLPDFAALVVVQEAVAVHPAADADFAPHAIAGPPAPAVQAPPPPMVRDKLREAIYNIT